VIWFQIGRMCDIASAISPIHDPTLQFLIYVSGQIAGSAIDNLLAVGVRHIILARPSARLTDHQVSLRPMPWSVGAAAIWPATALVGVSVRGDGGDSARAAIWRGGVGGWPSGPSAKVELRHFNRGREEIR
jgi:hypothetical protein